MFQIPEHISIKRRRQDEPVDVLYFEHEAHKDKRRFTDFCFQRVNSGRDNALDPAQTSSAGQASRQRVSWSDGPRIPVVRATSPQEEVRARARQQPLVEKFDFKEQKEHDVPDAHRKFVTSLNDTSKVGSSSNAARPRRFELAEHPPTVDDLGQLSTAEIKSRGEGHLTTFVETSTKAKTTCLDDVGTQPPTFKCDAPVVPTRKRPGPSFLKSRQQPRQTDERHENKLNPSNNVATTGLEEGQHSAFPGRNSEPEDLAAHLEKIALEVINTNAGNKTRHDIFDSNSVERETLSKTDTLADEDYIFETYVRKPLHGGKYLTDGSIQDARHVGYLVIRETEEGLWDTYVETEESDDWDEEEYDSNAEDNPANDYPEDFDSDEQHGSDESEDGEYDLNEVRY